MIKATTYARPYAKAAIAMAIKQASFVEWSKMLLLLSQAAVDNRVRIFINKQIVSKTNKEEFFCALGEGVFTQEQQNFIKILSGNNRLNLLPEISRLYEQYKMEYENEIKVNVCTVNTLTVSEQGLLEQALAQHFSKRLIVDYQTNQNLIGGVVVQVGDRVIDSSVRRRLQELYQELIR